MKRLLPFVLAALALSALPLDTPTFRTYVVPLGAPTLDLLVAPLDFGPTPDAVVVIGPHSGDASLLSLRGVGDGRLQIENLKALSELGYITGPRLAAAHLNQDDILDLGIAGVVEQINLGDGTLCFESSGIFPTFGGAEFGLGFTDIDSDGDLDSKILLDDFGGLFLDHGLNSGSGEFSLGDFDILDGLPAFGSRVIFADVDNDGRDETLVTTTSGLELISATLPNQEAIVEGGDFRELLAAHLNADRFLDIALTAPEARGVVVLLNDGAGGFPTAQLVGSFGRPECLAAGDVTGNGHTDLVVANRDNGTLAVLENDGAGQFTRVVRLPVSADPIEIEVADLDADGDLDVIVAGRASAELTVLLNQLAP